MRNVSLLEFRTRARQLSDTEGDVYVTDAELTSLANRHLTEVYDRLVAAGPPDRYASTTTFTTTVGIPQVGMLADFLFLVDVYAVESGLRTALQPMKGGALGSYRAPTRAVSIEVEYVPTPDVLVDDTDTFDGVNGWDELIVNLMAKDVMTKRESDPSVVLNNIARLEQRITSRARGYDRGHPKYVTDLDEVSAWNWQLGSPRPRAYRLRGNNLEIYEDAWGYP